jgi:hypothetical protein
MSKGVSVTVFGKVVSFLVGVAVTELGGASKLRFNFAVSLMRGDGFLYLTASRFCDRL